MKFRRAATALLAVACVFGMTAASAIAAEQQSSATSGATHASAAMSQSTANSADAEFVSMMIPHHYQALVMSRMVPERSDDDALRAMASRIDIEQSVEIIAMQGWQGRNGLKVTDAVESYEAMLGQPEMLERMGMATPEELDDLGAAEGTPFDVLFLELMIEHHEGAVDMAIDVIINGSDVILQQMATDILTTQYTQILQMEQMLADKTS